MVTKWIYRINAIIMTSEDQEINALWTVIAPGGNAEALTFRVKLSPTGLEPVTHLGTSTAATEEMRLLMSFAFAEEMAHVVVSVQDYRQNNWQDLLKAQGLKVIDDSNKI